MPDAVATATVAILLCKNKPNPHLLPPHRHSQRNIRRTRAKTAKPDWVCPMLFLLVPESAALVPACRRRRSNV